MLMGRVIIAQIYVTVYMNMYFQEYLRTIRYTNPELLVKSILLLLQSM